MKLAPEDVALIVRGSGIAGSVTEVLEDHLGIEISGACYSELKVKLEDAVSGVLDEFDVRAT